MPRRHVRRRPPSQPSPLHAQKRPRRKATPKPDKNEQTTERQRVIFSVGADLIRGTVPQAHQGTMFSHWCAQDFDTNEHSYSQAALVKTSDKYAATYRMPRAGRSTIASRSQELDFVSTQRREHVDISDKDGRLRHMIQSNAYRIDVAAMLQTLHEADPDHVTPVWEKMLRSLEGDQDHPIWTHNWLNNWPNNWRYSSTSSLSSASSNSATRKSSSPQGGGPDDDSLAYLSGGKARRSPSARGAGATTSTSSAQPRAERDDERVNAIGLKLHEFYLVIDPNMILSRVRYVAQAFGLDTVEEAVTRLVEHNEDFPGKIARISDSGRDYARIFAGRADNPKGGLFWRIVEFHVANDSAPFRAKDEIDELLAEASDLATTDEQARALCDQAAELASEHHLQVDVNLAQRNRDSARREMREAEEQARQAAAREAEKAEQERLRAEEEAFNERNAVHIDEHPDHYIPCARCPLCSRDRTCRSPVHVQSIAADCQEFVEHDNYRWYTAAKAAGMSPQATYTGQEKDPEPDAFPGQQEILKRVRDLCRKVGNIDGFEEAVGFMPEGLSEWTMEQFKAAEDYLTTQIMYEELLSENGEPVAATAV